MHCKLYKPAKELKTVALLIHVKVISRQGMNEEYWVEQYRLILTGGQLAVKFGDMAAIGRNNTHKFI